MTPDELKEKKNVSYGLIVWVGVICFNIGVLYATLLSAKDDISDNKKAARDYVEQEVGGLRSDWERQNEIEKAYRAKIMSELEELEKYHKD